jgi:hypothetical protein
MTNTKQQRWSILAIVLVALSLGLGAVNAHASQPSDMQISQTGHKQIACFVYSRYIGNEEAINIHLRRIGRETETAGAVYRLGYVEGLINGLASANAKRLGGYQVAQVHAAKFMYKVEGCTINEAI